MNIVQSIVSQRTRDGGSGSKKLTPDITRSNKNSNIKLRPRLNLANQNTPEYANKTGATTLKT